jgi:predicted NBD/HSP70 family sugar kinase
MRSRPSRNRRAVLAAAHRSRTFTRLDLVRATGLSSATVVGLVAELLADGVLVELDQRMPSGASGGRPAVALRLNPDRGTLIGIHLAHADVRVIVAALDGSIRAEHTHEIDVDHRPADSLEYVASAALDLVADLDLTHRELTGVGVAVSAPAMRSVPTLQSPILGDWSGIDIAATLGKRMGLGVQVGNDANLGALAESRLGAAAGVDNVVYVMLSEGVGAGLILSGQLYEGESGAAGELGHVTVVPGGQICRCGGRGCLETVVGARALIDTLAHSRGSTFGYPQLIEHARQGDPGLRRLLGDAGRAVGAALASICTILNPKLIVVGGTLAQTGEALLTGVADGLVQHVSPVTGTAPQVVRGALGVRAEALGAVMVAGYAADLGG